MGAQTTIGGATPRLVVLESIRKKAEHASRQHTSMTSVSAPAHRFQPCLSSCLGFLWSWTAICKCELKKPFPLKLTFWSWCFVAVIEVLTKTAVNCFPLLSACIVFSAIMATRQQKGSFWVRTAFNQVLSPKLVVSSAIWTYLQSLRGNRGLYQ